MGEEKEGVRLYHFPLRSGVVGGEAKKNVCLAARTHALFQLRFPQSLSLSISLSVCLPLLMLLQICGAQNQPPVPSSLTIYGFEFAPDWHQTTPSSLPPGDGSSNSYAHNCPADALGLQKGGEDPQMTLGGGGVCVCVCVCVVLFLFTEEM